MAADAPLIRTMDYAAIVARLAKELELTTARLEQAATPEDMTMWRTSITGRIRVLPEPDQAGARYALIDADEAKTIGGPVMLAGWLAPDTLVRAAASSAGEYAYLRRQPDALWALVCIFARMQETVIARLNRVPENLLHTFLNLVGTRIQPPSPARVPVTFQVPAGTSARGIVPAGTQVAAPAADGRPEVVFATERALPLTGARLVAALTMAPQQERYANHSIALDKGQPFAPFASDQSYERYEHCLYLANDELLGLSANKIIRIHVITSERERVRAVLSAGQVRMLTANGKEYNLECKWEDYQPDPKSPPIGLYTVLLKGTLVSDLGAYDLLFEDLKESQVGERSNRWIILVLPKEQCTKAASAVVEKIEIDVVIRAAAHVPKEGMLPEMALANTAPLDLNCPFMPFGERPRVGDVFFLQFPAPMFQSKSQIFVGIAMANKPTPHDLEIYWETWTGQSWGRLDSGITGHPEVIDSVRATVRFTSSGYFVLQLPDTVKPVKVAGKLGYWLRARIVKGDYGGEARYKAAYNPDNHNEIPYLHPDTQNPLFELESSGGVPPLIEWLRVGFSCTVFPDCVFLRHGPSLYDVTEQAAGKKGGIKPFAIPIDPDPALYLGFDAPFANGPAALYIGVEPLPAASSANQAPPEPLSLAWQYASADGGWCDLQVDDQTRALSTSGLVGFVAPAAEHWPLRSLFDKTHYWLRVCCVKGAAHAPKLRRLLTNTTWASHAHRVKCEPLGSSDGRQPGLSLRVSAPPVLPGQLVEVREERDTGWTTWGEQPDLYTAGPRECVYTIDRLAGEVRFGDGVRGMIPPRGSNNIRISYSTGGGAAGNLPAGAISKLKVAVPYVDAVTNLDPAAGGADVETPERARERGSHELRHGWCAVAAQDYEDLALAATPEVARAHVLTPDVDPIYEHASAEDLATQEHEAARAAGWVRLIIVPQSDEPAPIPTPELLRRVERYVTTRRPPPVDFDVLPPVYVPVEVKADVSVRTPEDGEGLIERVEAAISRYLHPLYGGPDGRGWPFGRIARGDASATAITSDLYALIAGVSGVDHVRNVSVTLSQDVPEQQRAFALLSAARPRVRLV